MRQEDEPRGAGSRPPTFFPMVDRDPLELVQIDEASPQSITANVIVIEERALLRECLTDCLKAVLGYGVLSFATVENWLKVSSKTSACLVVLSAGARPKNAESVQREIELLRRAPAPLPMIFLSDTEEPKQILDTLEQGARGYIPTSTSLRLAIEAIRLVRAGGTYAPA